MQKSIEEAVEKQIIAKSRFIMFWPRYFSIVGRNLTKKSRQQFETEREIEREQKESEAYRNRNLQHVVKTN